MVDGLGGQLMRYSIKYAHPAEAMAHWETIAACLEPAIAVAGGRFHADDLLALVLEGRYHTLVVEGEDGAIVAALTAAVINYPRMRVLEVSFLGGTQGLLWGRDMLQTVENMAKLTGCSRLEFRGRKEWDSVLRHDGYKAVGILYEKAIEPCVSATALGQTELSSTAH